MLEGIAATLVTLDGVMSEDDSTGELPGRALRGPAREPSQP